MQRFVLAIVMCLFTVAANAQTYTEPARGSELRSDILDAIRPVAEWNLGAPVEFVVWDMRVNGDVAFVSVWAQRPGGGKIDMATTPIVKRNQLDPEAGDGPAIQALLQRSGRMWVGVEYGISPSDVWWDWDEYCPIWSTVIPETCP